MRVGIYFPKTWWTYYCKKINLQLHVINGKSELQSVRLKPDTNTNTYHSLFGKVHFR